MDHFIKSLEAQTRDVLDPGLRARNRLHGVSPANTRDQKAGSAIGRFCLQGHITAAQYDAAIMFIESHYRNLRAIDAPPPPGAVDLNATRGRPVGVEDVTQLARWRREHRDACGAIQEKQNEIRLMGHLFGAVDAVLFRDNQMDRYLGDLRIALNALVKHYGLLARAA